ncbi:hypothetical protein F9222_25825, partial [Escherichia coli]
MSEFIVHFYKVRYEMKKESDRILKRSVLSGLVAAALYTSQVMAFTDPVDSGSTVEHELVENGTQNVYGETNNITVGENGEQNVYSGGITNDTVLKDGGVQYVYDRGTANGTILQKGAGASGIIQNVYDGGTANNTIINEGGMQYVSNKGTATGATIKDGGGQIVWSGGTATGTTIENGGLMQNAGEDSSTTVKDGGVYELGRNNVGSTDSPYYLYYGTARASDLTVEAGGRAEVYAGTLTGATVSGANA